VATRYSNDGNPILERPNGLKRADLKRHAERT
jgi:hypothetical protein